MNRANAQGKTVKSYQEYLKTYFPARSAREGDKKQMAFDSGYTIARTELVSALKK